MATQYNTSIKRWESLPILEQQLQQKLGDLIPRGGSGTVLHTLLLYSLISTHNAFSHIYRRRNCVLHTINRK